MQSSAAEEKGTGIHCRRYMCVRFFRLANLSKLDEELLMPLLVTACAPSADTAAPPTDSTADTNTWSHATAAADVVVVVVVVGIENTPVAPLILFVRLHRLLRSILVLMLILMLMPDCLHQKPATEK